MVTTSLLSTGIFGRFVITTIAVVLVLTLLGPYAVLAIARQETSKDNYNYSDSFLNSYDDVRRHLGERVEMLRAEGIAVEYDTYAVDQNDDLYIDNIYLPATSETTNLILLTTGVHGMEGYIGSVMLVAGR